MHARTSNAAEALALRMIERAGEIEKTRPNLAEAERADAAKAYALGDRVSKPAPKPRHPTRRTVYHSKPIVTFSQDRDPEAGDFTKPVASPSPTLSPGQLALMKQCAVDIGIGSVDARCENGGLRYALTVSLGGGHFLGVTVRGTEAFFDPERA